MVCDDLSRMFLFADDAKLYRSIKDISDFACLNRVCSEVFNWSASWLMKLNISKCKVLPLCRNSSNIVKYDYGFEVQGQGFVALEHECCMKDLGVTMCSNLSFDDHIHDKISISGSKCL